ncbi:hypothetical protein Emed_003668 [Eimeria media]
MPLEGATCRIVSDKREASTDILQALCAKQWPPLTLSSFVARVVPKEEKVGAPGGVQYRMMINC